MGSLFPDITYCVEKSRAEQKKASRKVDGHFAEQYEDSMVNSTFLEAACNITKEQYLEEFVWTSIRCKNATAVWEGASDDLDKTLTSIQMQLFGGRYMHSKTEKVENIRSSAAWNITDLEGRRCFTHHPARKAREEGVANILIFAKEVGELFIHTPGLFLTRDIALSHYAEEVAKYVRRKMILFVLSLPAYNIFIGKVCFGTEVI